MASRAPRNCLSPWPIALLLLVQMCLAGARLGSTFGACPSACTCKWKGGKRSVECPERGLIMIPENLDPETQVLDMSGNNLQILPREAFLRAGLVNLQKAFLKECRLGQIDELAFSGLTNLVELDLSGNLLTAVPSQSFQGVPFLRELSLCQNPIQKIDGHAFKTVPSLVKLDLGGCEIRILATTAFDGLDLLGSLRLDGNRLSELRPRTVESLRRLSGVQLHDNPWHCDCRLRPLRDWMAAANVARTVEPACAEPESLATRSLVDLGPDDLACRPEMLVPPRRRFVESPAGGNVSLSCRAGGVPTPALFWAREGRPVLDGSSMGPPGPTSRVIIREEDSGPHERKSTLYLPDSREGDATDLTCVAENKAGSAEATFSLRVTASGAASSSSVGGIAALGASLFILVLFILVVVFLLLLRNRSPTKTPTAAASGSAVDVKPVGGESTARKSRCSRGDAGGGDPVRKPSTDTPYATNHYEGGGSIMVAPGNAASSCMAGNSVAMGNYKNPDLVPEGERMAEEGAHLGLERTGLPLTGSGIRESVGLTGSSAVAYQICTMPGSRGGTRADEEIPEPHVGPLHAGDAPEAEEAAICSPACHPLTVRYHEGGYPPDYGLPVCPPPSAKTLRVWQRGVPVLPPVNALKRVKQGSRDSPDEGYQEGCATDV